MACALLLAPLPGTAAAQSVRAGDLELDFLGRVQFQVNGSTIDDPARGATPPAVAFEVRRARLGTLISYGWLTGAVELELTGPSPSLKDGWIDGALAEAFRVRVGQFKRPFGAFELVSSAELLTIERTARIPGLAALVGVPGEALYLLSEGGYVNRQVGVMVHGRAAGLSYGAGVFNGEGANEADVRGSKAYAARLSWAPLEPLRIAAGVSGQPTAVAGGSVGGGGTGGTGDGGTGAAGEVQAVVWGADVFWGGFRRPGLRLMAEAMAGDDPLILDGRDPASMAGAQVVVGWFMPRPGRRVEGVEPVFRVSWADPDLAAGDDAGLLVTSGLNLYFAGWNRLMVNGDVYVPGQDGLGPELGLVGQLQIFF